MEAGTNFLPGLWDKKMPRKSGNHGRGKGHSRKITKRSRRKGFNKYGSTSFLEAMIIRNNKVYIPSVKYYSQGNLPICSLCSVLNFLSNHHELKELGLQKFTTNSAIKSFASKHPKDIFEQILEEEGKDGFEISENARFVENAAELRKTVEGTEGGFLIIAENLDNAHAIAIVNTQDDFGGRQFMFLNSWNASSPINNKMLLSNVQDKHLNGILLDRETKRPVATISMFIFLVQKSSDSIDAHIRGIRQSRQTRDGPIRPRQL